jgi:uncharacterized membrane protein YhaH (DUF805 family)
MGVFRFLLGYRGRATRLRWWLQMIGAKVFLFGLIIGGALWLYGSKSARPSAQTVQLSMYVTNVAMLLYIWLVVSVSIRRLHDLGKSAWWTLILVVAPILSFSLGAIPFFSPNVSAGFKLLSGVMALVTAVWLGFTKGEQEDNRFGPAMRTQGKAALAT